MRSPERKKDSSVSPTNENNELKSQRTDEVERTRIDDTYGSFQLQPATKMLALPPPEPCEQNTESKEERFNSFQVVANQETKRNNSSRTPSPRPDSKETKKSKITNENKVRRISPSPHLESVNNGKTPNEHEDSFVSFQICPQKAILALPPPASPSPTIDSKEGSAPKTEFDSFQIYSEQGKAGDNINSNNRDILEMERNRIDISSFSSEVSKTYNI